MGQAFEETYAEMRLRDFCADRVALLSMRLFFTALALASAALYLDVIVPFLMWFAAVLVTQACEWALLRRMLAETEDASLFRRRGTRLAIAGTILLSTLTYGAFVPIAWLAGPDVLKLVAIALALGSVAAVCTRAFAVPWLISGMSAVYSSMIALVAATHVAEGQMAALPETLVGLVAWAGALAHFSLGAKRSRDIAHSAALTASQAEAAVRSRNSLLATVSHELRTPMNAILGSADLLARRLLPPQDSELVETMRSSSAILIRHLDDILDLARMDAGAIEFDVRPFAPSAAFERLERLWAARAAQKGLELTVTLAPALPEGLLGDEHRLGQIVGNLISNAIKFTSEGTVCVHVSRDEGKLVVAVRDTGVGMQPEEIARLFEPYAQANPQIAGRFGGTGLGLAIARGLALGMGGTLTVESEAGVGTTFTLHLPMTATCLPRGDRSSPQASPPCVDERPEGSADGMRVLVAEDNDASMMIICRYLELAGCVPVRAANGAVALEQARLQLFDAVLLDVRMPVMDGLEACALLRGREGPNRDTPVIMLSADAGSANIEAGLAAGADAYLTKPVVPHILFEALAKALQGRAALAGIGHHGEAVDGRAAA
jgi:two-component system, sensor histidine kinase